VTLTKRREYTSLFFAVERERVSPCCYARSAEEETHTPTLRKLLLLLLINSIRDRHAWLARVFFNRIAVFIILEVLPRMSPLLGIEKTHSTTAVKSSKAQLILLFLSIQR
jgi:hypothetical protein